jgi:uncharacterized membrane protein YphA (DoxX/SURF4 family)
MIDIRAFSRANAGLLVLRLGLAAVFVWFGLSQVLDAHSWQWWVKDWVSDLTRLSPEIIVYLNGSFEVIFGALLALGVRIKVAATALALHIAIVTLYVGYNEVGVRDFGLTMATIALALLAKDD